MHIVDSIDVGQTVNSILTGTKTDGRKTMHPTRKKRLEVKKIRSALKKMRNPFGYISDLALPCRYCDGTAWHEPDIAEKDSENNEVRIRWFCKHCGHTYLHLDRWFPVEDKRIVKFLGELMKRRIEIASGSRKERPRK
jgi:hypothetical protein